MNSMIMRRDTSYSPSTNNSSSRSSVNMKSYRVVSESSSSPCAPSYSSETESQSEDVQSPQSLFDIQKKILSRSVSRCGRDQQRFVADPETGVVFRLTAGAVPIMPDGKIVLISSGRADGWILPKGGWERDESIEVGAHRETFEEAGVLGVLGPKLTDVEYETRKGKKRRLELESLAKLKHGKLLRSGSSFESSRSSSFLSLDDGDNGVDESEAVSNPSGMSNHIGHHTSNSSNVVNGSLLPDLESMPRSGENKSNSHQLIDDSTISSPDLAADTIGEKSCTFVRMSMFVMYVSEVREEWPESDRSRKLVGIDEAIEAMSERPEFLTVLLEVKRNGYHLYIPIQDSNRSKGESPI